jgi:hypothetical protein
MRSELFWDFKQRKLYLITDISGQNIGPNFKGQVLQKACLALKDGTDKMSRTRKETTNVRCLQSQKSADIYIIFFL